MKRVKQVALLLKVAPTLHFEARIGDEVGVLPLNAEQAKSLGSALFALGMHLEAQEQAATVRPDLPEGTVAELGARVN
jgi:hypothetical protein